ncbi:hypothetical protein AMECASPLE_004554 [Ameca splendens]|uniref:Uncharacterized protein n=1 Tax=Ameca splendens TaxID=208324 RepID=A0ABV0YAB3_9TELE
MTLFTSSRITPATHNSKIYSPSVLISCFPLPTILIPLSSSVNRPEGTGLPDHPVEISCVTINLFNQNSASVIVTCSRELYIMRAIESSKLKKQSKKTLFDLCNSKLFLLFGPDTFLHQNSLKFGPDTFLYQNRLKGTVGFPLVV